VGTMFEYFCGRSTFKMPVSLSSSYLTVSVGTISIKTLTTSGASGPIGTPCQGWARNIRPRTSRILAPFASTWLTSSSRGKCTRPSQRVTRQRPVAHARTLFDEQGALQRDEYLGRSDDTLAELIWYPPGADLGAGPAATTTEEQVSGRDHR